MNILVADDHHLFLDGIKYVIASLGDNVSVSTAPNRSEVLALFSQKIEYDLALIDMNLGDEDGVELLQYIYENIDAGLPAIMVSAEVDPSKIYAATKLGASGFLPKSSNGDEMLGAINKVLSGGTHIPPKVKRDIQTYEKSLARFNALTKKQTAVLDLLAQGRSNREIAETLFLTESTVKSHVMQIFQKLEVKNRVECVLMAQGKLK